MRLHKQNEVVQEQVLRQARKIEQQKNAEMVMAAAVAVASRTVLVVSTDAGLRQRLRSSLSGMRWSVVEASGGAEAMGRMDGEPAEAVLIDAWLPDLEASEFAAQMHAYFPGTEVLRVDGSAPGGVVRSPRRHELLHALREAQDGGLAVVDTMRPIAVLPVLQREMPASGPVFVRNEGRRGEDRLVPARLVAAQPPPGIEEMIGGSAVMQELARLIRLVAPRSATVLIEGETGTGKEVVAKALHRLSARSQKAFVVLNCAAIPESLLEAELFGHTRGAFTGADRARTGRIETAHGGTLFLDEIGEMPFALQAKLLRFLENGEIQRVGENDVVRVDVRVIAATHQHLEQRAMEGTFRLDLYHRLAVFPIEVPALRERKQDIAELAEHFLARLGKEMPRKMLSHGALERLNAHEWPGNVRELAHVLERAAILTGDEPVIGADEVRVRRRMRG